MHADHWVRALPDIEAKPKPKPKGYDEDIAFLILERIGDGESLSDICKTPGFPAASTFYRWLTNEDFRCAYQFALMAKFDRVAEDIIKIADDSKADFEVGDNGELNGHKEMIERTRERIAARKWHAAKMLPRIYGEMTAMPAPAADVTLIAAQKTIENRTPADDPLAQAVAAWRERAPLPAH